jgi:hypothetical protein
LNLWHLTKESRIDYSPYNITALCPSVILAQTLSPLRATALHTYASRTKFTFFPFGRLLYTARYVGFSGICPIRKQWRCLRWPCHLRIWHHPRRERLSERLLMLLRNVTDKHSWYVNAPTCLVTMLLTLQFVPLYFTGTDRHRQSLSIGRRRQSGPCATLLVELRR